MTDPNQPLPGEDIRYPPTHGRGSDVESRRERRRRQEMFNAQDGLCHWCRQKMQMNPLRRSPITRELKNNPRFASFEHVLPKSMGGTNHRSNIVLAHASCNNKRKRRQFPHDPIYGKEANDEQRNNIPTQSGIQVCGGR